MDPLLFTPYKVKDINLKNRIVMAPMCIYSSDENGSVTDRHLEHYAARAIGQVGTIIVEATAVCPNGRITKNDLGVWSDDHIPGLTKLANTIKSNGATAAIQLAHAGRKCETTTDIMAPSPIKFDSNSNTPKAMTNGDIEDTIQYFVKAAKRVQKAGFEIIEIHAAHGYLIHEFLSPLSNKRNDNYGACAENRFRILHEIIESIKSFWDGPIFVRISGTDYHEEGLNIEDQTINAKKMKDLNIDLIDVSSGGLVNVPIKYYPGYQIPFSEKIKYNAQIATGAVGQITHGSHAEEVLQNERADLVIIGRELLRNPYWPRTAALELNFLIDKPEPYKYAW